VRGVKHADVLLPLHAAQGLARLVRDVRVEARGRLVEHEELGCVDQRFAEIDPRGLARRELAGDAVAEVRDLEKREQFVDPAADAADAVDQPEDKEVLPDEEVRG